MLPLKQRRSRVVYVARSARELPQAVRDWLGATEHRAMACPSTYEALASLTGRQRPSAIIVSIASLDFDELEFFDLARRLSRDTRLYVTGDGQEAKLEAALERGALPFDAGDLDQAADQPGPADVVQPPSPVSRDVLRTIPPEREAAPEIPRAWRRTAPAEPVNQSPAPAEPLPESSGKALETPEPNPAEASADPATAFRLLRPADEEVEAEPPADESSVPVPWAPSSRRPQRTPPPARSEQTSQSRDISKPPVAQEPERPPAVQDVPNPAFGVELTAAELAALMGKPVPPDVHTGQERSS